MNKKTAHKQLTGFTLVEVLVAATILATLIGGVLLTLNPIAQINKGQDAQRLADLQSIKTAVDLYYNDTKCYPTQLPFGQVWKVMRSFA
jgi:prepilin-type N-terminal cleavage/methylation domain-containing protein